MKNLAVLLFLLAFTKISMGQDIHITFSGQGLAKMIDSVKVTNLNTTRKITLPGNDTLILDQDRWVQTIKEPYEDIGLFYYPQQAMHLLTFTQSNPEDIKITVQNLLGQVVYEYFDFMDKGLHAFEVSFGRPGTYIISISSDTKQTCLKVVCQLSNNRPDKVVYSGCSTSNLSLNSQIRQKTDYRLGYSMGDVLHLRCKSGKFVSIITDSPKSSMNYKVDIYDCTDRDNRTYDIVKIGNQLWMAENLAYLPSISPSNIGSDGNPHYYVYGYEGTSILRAKNSDSYNKYGVLYNWSAATEVKHENGHDVCPIGWHLPSDKEWNTLEEYLGMSKINTNDYGRRFSGDVGSKLKSNSGWYKNGNGSNISGFNALPIGDRDYYGGFSDRGKEAIFWTSTPDGSSDAWFRFLYCGTSASTREKSYKRHGFAVRCLMDVE